MRSAGKAIGASALAAFLALGISGAAHAYDVPVRLTSDNHLVIDTFVNEQGPFPFIVDSAASGTLVFDGLRARAGLEPVDTEEEFTVQAASGPVTGQAVTLGTLRIGEGEFDIPQTISLTIGEELGRSAFGIIGADVLYRQPVGFALSEGRLRLYEEDIAIDPDTDLDGNWFSVPITTVEWEGKPSGFYWTDVSINGVVIPALIDTGAQRSTINSAAAERLGIDGESHSLAEDEPITSASRDAVAAYHFPIGTLQLGERIWAARSLSLADLPVFDIFVEEGEPIMLLGSDFLAEQNFIIDPIANALWVQQRRSAALGGLTTVPDTENSAARN